jgi:hypothetical protein
MSKVYVTKVEDHSHVTGTRISLDSLARLPSAQIRLVLNVGRPSILSLRSHTHEILLDTSLQRLLDSHTTRRTRASDQRRCRVVGVALQRSDYAEKA